MENPSLYRLLFLIARALPASKPVRSNSSESAVPVDHTGRGFTLTGNVFLPSTPIPGAAGAEIDAGTRGGQYVELSGTLRVSTDQTNSATISFYQAGQLLRTVYLTSITCGEGSASQMKCTLVPPQDRDLADAAG